MEMIEDKDIELHIDRETLLQEYIPRKDYEQRLKADMVAMLEELDLTIDEISIVTRHGVTGTVMTAQGMRKKIKENIQHKINALKENSHDD